MKNCSGLGTLDSPFQGIPRRGKKGLNKIREGSWRTGLKGV
jgi:hypothetical protein